MGEQVTVAQGSLPHRLAVEGHYDLALANISARVIKERADSLLPVLGPAGKLIASGIIDEQRPVAEDALLEAGFIIEEVCQREDWVTLICSPGK